mmetsp:Transcript_17484/g.26041  ORF Transcript_17484/g.26041 Transcript_17484/m.26041 type:complete len:116 (-) Transcript_17484:1080-1427(-)
MTVSDNSIHIFRVSSPVPLYCIPVYSSILIRENGGDGECEFGCGDDECLFFRSSGTIYGPTSGRLVHFVEKRLHLEMSYSCGHQFHIENIPVALIHTPHHRVQQTHTLLMPSIFH